MIKKFIIAIFILAGVGLYFEFYHDKLTNINDYEYIVR